MTDTQTAETPDVRATQPVGVVTKVGRLGGDFELKYSDKGRAFARASMAVDVPKVEGDWKGEKDTIWYDLIAFGTNAEHAAESLAKGDRVVVYGRAEVEQYTKKDGTPGLSRKILVDEIGPTLRWATATVAKAAFKPSQATAEPTDFAF